MIRMTVRGYGNGVKLFEETFALEEVDLEAVAEKHIESILQYEKHMLEVELLDAPLSERFLRFGTDTSGMVNPIELKIEKDQQG